MKPGPQSLKPLLAPASIAIIGASDDPGRIGGRPVRYLKDAGYEGAIYPVNPNRETIQGIRSFPSISAIDAPIDCAIVSVPVEAALDAVRECAARGVRSTIVFSAGFAEIGEEGRERQAELTRIARSSGMRILGPNTVGAVNTALKSYQTFSMATEQAAGRIGRVGMATQSGGYGSYFLHLSRRQGVSFGQWVTTGNECDVEIGEVLRYFAEDPGIDVLMGYVEGVRDRDAFIGALETARRNGKPVVMLKVGSSAAGASAAASHTAALAGSDKIYEAVFREYGVHRARTPEEFLDVAYAASCGRLPKSRHVAVLTTSGGMGVHAADFLTDAGLELPSIDAGTQEELLRLSPFGAAGNPIDTTAQFVNKPELLNDMLDLVLGTGKFDTALTLLAHAAVSTQFAPKLVKALSPLPEAHPDKLLALAMAAPEWVIESLREAGFLVFEDLGRAAVALGALVGFTESFSRAKETEPETPAAAEPLASPLNEWQAKQLVARYGVSLPAERVAADPDSAAAAAAALGFPVALKILSADIAHKTEVGGVAIGLPDAEAVRDAAVRMSVSVARLKPEAAREGFIVSRMVTGGVECIVGVVRDPVFGPVVMFGLGGVSVEVFGDVTFRLAPVGPDEADRMIREIKAFALLSGHRGRAAGDLVALREAIVGLSRLAAANGGAIRSIEVNPLLVMPEGQGVVALDAAVELDERS